MDKNEARLINALRNYYFSNYKNGVSDESFIVWLEARLQEIRAQYAAQPWENRPRWLQGERGIFPGPAASTTAIDEPGNENRTGRRLPAS